MSYYNLPFYYDNYYGLTKPTPTPTPTPKKDPDMFIVFNATAKTADVTLAQVNYYTTEFDAIKRAEKLSQETPGSQFCVMKAITKTSTPKPAPSTVRL